MNFYTIIILGYILIAIVLLYIVFRDKNNSALFLGKHKKFAWIFSSVLILGIILAVDARFVEPNILITRKFNIESSKINSPFKIAFIADLQVGMNKKTNWVEKIVKKIEEINPDIVLLGGDLISNEYTFEDESVHLIPLARITAKYPIFAVLGNHEYGIGTKNYTQPGKGTGDRSALLVDRLNTLGIPTLKNELSCLEVRNNDICVFGLDDLWGNRINNSTFNQLKNWDEKKYLIFLSHNPDGILFWEENYKKPDITLSGHTHNGQIYLPFFGPLGQAGIELGKEYYHGLKNWQETPLIITAGAGESGGQIRLFNPPEIMLINIQ